MYIYVIHFKYTMQFITCISANTGTTNVRSNLRPLLRSYGVKMESEKDIKLAEEMYTVSKIILYS